MPMSLTQLSFGSQKKNQVPSSSSQSFHNYYDGYEVAEEEGDRVEFSDKDEVGDEEEIGSAEDCLSVPTVEQQFDLDRGATNEVIVREDENISISYQVQELKGEESHELVHIISQHVNTISNIELCEPHGGSVWEEEAEAAAADVNEKREPDEEPNTIGALLVAAAETDDAPNEKTVGGDSVVELKMEDFGAVDVVDTVETEFVGATDVAPNWKMGTVGNKARAGEGEANMEELKPGEPLRLVLLGGALKEKMLPVDVEVERAEETEASDFPTISMPGRVDDVLPLDGKAVRSSSFAQGWWGGLNNPLKQKEILSFIRGNKISLFGVVEAKSQAWVLVLQHALQPPEEAVGVQPEYGPNCNRGMSLSMVSDNGNKAEWLDRSSEYSSSTSLQS
ncbi:hypothetical protein RHGRI_027309 [Rhododendron griersonianum]|uniref:Uncharacterized protein n=1 Tax=Rhododendron griersonianum TaxID=479676 RepID=A0AAV6IZV1_9ERIC|nr:hypothetical protein RHGRI_027309 [Rhododendron griersonianum]